MPETKRCYANPEKSSLPGAIPHVFISTELIDFYLHIAGVYFFNPKYPKFNWPHHFCGAPHAEDFRFRKLLRRMLPSWSPGPQPQYRENPALPSWRRGHLDPDSRYGAPKIAKLQNKWLYGRYTYSKLVIMVYKQTYIWGPHPVNIFHVNKLHLI